MDPVTIVSLVGTVVGLISKSTKIAKDLNDLGRRYRETQSTLQKIVNECQTLSAAASQIKIWIEVKLSKMPLKHQQQMAPLRNALRDFAAILEPLEADVTNMLSKARPLGKLPFSVKFSSLWNEDKMKGYLDDLRWQANAIHFLLSATQLLPKESLKRMESIAHTASMFREGSLFNDTGSTIDNLEFEFDHLLINTATYRRALKSHAQRPSNSSEHPNLSVKTNDDIASYISRAKMRGDGLTAVHLASENGQIEILSECIEAGFNISLKTGTKRWTPLHYAAENNHQPAVELLLEQGAENVPDNQGQTPLNLAAGKPSTQLVVNCFLQRLDRNPLPIEESHLSPLHIAAREGRDDLMQYLAGPEGVNVLDKNGLTPLHFACKNGYLRCAKLLLESGIDVNVRGTWTHPGETVVTTCLGLAIRAGNEALVRLLLDNGASRVDAEDHWSAEKLAIWRGNINVIEVLSSSIDFKNSIFPVGSNGNRGVQPALGFACYDTIKGKRFTVVKWLIDHGCQPNDPNTWGSSAMHQIAAENYVNVAALLFQVGADLNLQNKLGNTPLHTAVGHGSVNMVRFLLENGASPSIKNKDGNTPFEYGFYGKTVDGTLITEEMKKEIRALLVSYSNKDFLDHAVGS